MMKEYNELVGLLKVAPSNHLDPIALAKINIWDDMPSSIQVLEVLDMCIYGSLGSALTVAVLQALYDMLLKMENITHEDNLQFATWRNN
jgi:hypothetical protein